MAWENHVQVSRLCVTCYVIEYVTTCDIECVTTCSIECVTTCSIKCQIYGVLCCCYANGQFDPLFW